MTEFDPSKIKIDISDNLLLADQIISEASKPVVFDTPNMIDFSSMNTDYVMKANPALDLSPSADIVRTSLYNPIIDTVEKPTIQEEISKIHEELSNLTKTNYVLCKAVEKKDKTIKQLEKENEQLKSKLKRTKAKTKSQRESIEVQEIELDDQQSQIDKLETRMNEAEDVLHIKKEGV